MKFEQLLLTMLSNSGELICGLLGNVKEGEVIFFRSYFLDTDDLLSGHEISFKITSLQERDDGHIELQGLLFCETNEECSATLVLNPNYDTDESGTENVGMLRL
jgi:hypothetical protein